jgi:hypothetical protein
MRTLQPPSNAVRACAVSGAAAPAMASVMAVRSAGSDIGFMIAILSTKRSHRVMTW